MKTLMLMAASSAALALAADSGSGSGSGQTDDLLKSDAAPHPQTADEKAPAEPQPDPQVGAVGNAEGANPNPPSTLSDAETTRSEGPEGGSGDDTGGKKSKADKKAGAAKPAAAKKPEADAPKTGVKRAYMVWVQPGHETLGIGQMIAVPTADADVLRGAGRARFASEAEVAAAKDSKSPTAVLHLDGV